MKEQLKRYLFPTVEDEVQLFIDKETIHNICYLSFWAAVFELLTFLLFITTNRQFDQRAFLNMGSVLYCILVCGAACLCTRWMIKNEKYEKQSVQDFKITYYFLLTLWAIWVSYQNYARGGQLFTFFAVELMMVCFITFRPIASIALGLGTYSGLYAVLYTIDGAQGFLFLNYFVLTLVSIMGMLVRFWSQVRTADTAVQLRRSNDLLYYTSRHDGLTGLRNRLALEEDASSFLGKKWMFYMIDIDYFKEINDLFGHMAGDKVLREVAQVLQSLFPDACRYRFGGDEFLVISPDTDAPFEKDIHIINTAAVPDKEITLSFGRSSGTPEDHDALFALINKADEGLYETKRRIHSPEFGGRDRRRARK